MSTVCAVEVKLSILMRVGMDMRLLHTLLLALLASLTFAQVPPPKQEPRFIRIPVFHADPYLIVALLEGRQVMQPEISSLLDFVGFPPATGNTLMNIFGKGKLIVNPTDNSIIFIPEVGG
jgi:hypothetical protein